MRGKESKGRKERKSAFNFNLNSSTDSDTCNDLPKRLENEYIFTFSWTELGKLSLLVFLNLQLENLYSFTFSTFSITVINHHSVDNMNRQCLCCDRRKELEYMHLFTLDIYRRIPYNINLIGTLKPRGGHSVRFHTGVCSSGVRTLTLF